MLHAKALLSDKGKSEEIVTPQPETFRLKSVEILKLFKDNFLDISSMIQIKQACIKIFKLKKASPSLRSRLFTRRACDVKDFYYEIGRPDPKIPEENRVAV